MKAKPLGVQSGTDLYLDPNINVWTHYQEHYRGLKWVHENGDEDD